MTKIIASQSHYAMDAITFNTFGVLLRYHGKIQQM